MPTAATISDSADIEDLAPNIQHHALFPSQVNVGVAQMTSTSSMQLVVYERGAGLTTACGSGACVAAYAALASGLTDQRNMTVEMPAGKVCIDIDDNGAATMTGPVTKIYTGEIKEEYF